MKYRIKKVTRPSGWVYYQAQISFRWWVWWDIDANGDTSTSSWCDTYQHAEKRIALHILNTKKDKVEYFPIKIDKK